MPDPSLIDPRSRPASHRGLVTYLTRHPAVLVHRPNHPPTLCRFTGSKRGVLNFRAERDGTRLELVLFGGQASPKESGLRFETEGFTIEYGEGGITWRFTYQ